MAQLDTSIPMSIQPGPSAMQQMTQAMNLASMMQARQDAIAARQAQAAAAQEQKRQQRLVQQGATQGQSPIDLVGMGVDPAALKEYSDLYNKHQDWLLKDRDAKDKLQKENLKALAGAAYDLDPNDPTALQIFQERAKLLGISTDGLPQNLGAIKNLAAMALTPQEKIAQQQKETEFGIQKNAAETQKYVAETNRKNSQTQAGNLQLEREKFEYDKNKPKEIKPITPASAETISGTGFALTNLKTLLDKVNSGDADVFKTTLTGAFVDPELNNALRQLTEFHGRQQSGAAISNKEWKTFKSEILNPNFLLTVKGRKAAVKNINDFIGRYYTKGKDVSGNENWYEDYKKGAQSGVDKVTGDNAPTNDFNSFWNEVNK